MKLFLRYAGGVSGVDVFPAGAMTVAAGANTRNGWKQYCCAKLWGRSRVTVKYADGTNQVLSYT